MSEAALTTRPCRPASGWSGSVRCRCEPPVHRVRRPGSRPVTQRQDHCGRSWPTAGRRGASPYGRVRFPYGSVRRVALSTACSGRLDPAKGRRRPPPGYDRAGEAPPIAPRRWARPRAMPDDRRALVGVPCWSCHWKVGFLAGMPPDVPSAQSRSKVAGCVSRAELPESVGRNSSGVEWPVETAECRDPITEGSAEDQAVDLGQQSVCQLAAAGDPYVAGLFGLQRARRWAGLVVTSSTAGSGRCRMVVENTMWRRCG